MREAHTYHVSAWWTSGPAGLVKADSAPNAIHFTAPPEFGGFEGRWTPEDFLLGAVASCFVATFRAIADYARFEYGDLEVDVHGTLSPAAAGYVFSEIVIRPKLRVMREEQKERASVLLEKAKRSCLVSRALAVAQEFESSIEAGTLVLAE